jgi:uncharacterized protein (DUF1778 family)
MSVQMTHNAHIIFWDCHMETTTAKESRLNIRCDSHTRQLLDKAAGYAHVTISEFVLSHALASAERIVQTHESITLKPKDFEAFLAALDTPAKPNAALKRAFKRHADQIGS